MGFGTRISITTDFRNLRFKAAEEAQLLQRALEDRAVVVRGLVVQEADEVTDRYQLKAVRWSVSL